MDFDDFAFVPVATGLKMFNQSSLLRIMSQAGDAQSVQPLIRQIKEILIERHDGLEDFTIITQDALLSTFRSIIDVITIALAGIAAISLAVAGIGIMNVMLVSVSERTAEVGLMKALGARRRQIVSVFLLEAVLLSGLGAVAGSILGVIAVLAGAGLWRTFPLAPSATWLILVLLLALGAGAAFGLMPARRAARLMPADALRAGK
jgi:putative ABC transport system permease protein